MFKPGDIVVCIENGCTDYGNNRKDVLTIGKKYKVLDCIKCGHSYSVYHINDKGNRDGCDARRFKRAELINEIDYLDAFKRNFEDGI